MAVLGVGGRVLLKRPCPTPCDVYGEQLINIGSDRCPEYTLTDGFYPGCDAFDVNCPGWQNGDHISVEGLPIFSPSGQPYNPTVTEAMQAASIGLVQTATISAATQTIFIRPHRSATTTANAVMMHTFMRVRELVMSLRVKAAAITGYILMSLGAFVFIKVVA